MSELELKVTHVKDLTQNIKMFEFVAANGGDLPVRVHASRLTIHGHQLVLWLCAQLAGR